MFFVAMVTLVLSTQSVAAGDHPKIRKMQKPIKDRYLVQLRDVSPATIDEVVRFLERASASKVDYIFRHAALGFSATMTEHQAEVVANSPYVAFVEEVAEGYLSAVQTAPPWHLDRIDQKEGSPYFEAPLNGRYEYCELGTNTVAYVVGTGVARDHQEFLRPDGSSRVLPGVKYATDHYSRTGDAGADYGYAPCGVGTDPAVVDFNNVLIKDANSPWLRANAPVAVRFTGGHETAVASLIGGNTYGVAKGAQIVPLRVAECGRAPRSDWTAWALDWIMDPARNPYFSTPTTWRGPGYGTQWRAVLNMSFYFATQNCGTTVPAQESAASFVESEINAILGYTFDGSTCQSPVLIGTSPQYAWPGIPVVTSANNQNWSQTMGQSPARMAYGNTAAFGSCGRVLSVGGSDEQDRRWQCADSSDCIGAEPSLCNSQVVAQEGSNFGPTVDIYAPAHNITSAGITGASSQRDQFRSGTSFSAPIVTGVLLRMMAKESSYYSPDYWSNTVRSSVNPRPFAGESVWKPLLNIRGYTTCSPQYP